MHHKTLFSLFSTLLLVIFATLPALASTKRTVALTDVHGAYYELLKVLQQSNVIDQQLQWTGDVDTLVITGDNLDRGPDSRKVLDLWIRLEKEAAAANGEVVALLGNHEAMNIMPDLRYVADEEFAAFTDEESKPYRQKIYQDYLQFFQQDDNQESQKAFLKLYPPGYFGLVKAFSPGGYYGRWLLTKDVIRTVNGRTYVHGGISQKLLDLGLSESELNQRFRHDLAQYATLYHQLIDSGLFKHHFSKKQRKEAAQAVLDAANESQPLDSTNLQDKAQKFLDVSDSLMLTTFGPIWYRGNIYCHAYSEEQVIDSALKHFNSTQLLVGHTPDKSRLVRSRFNNKLILMDTGMLRSHYSGHPSAVTITDGELTVVNIDDDSATTPLPDPVRKPLYPNGYSDSYLKDFFKQAEVKAATPLTQNQSETNHAPLKLTFKLNDKTHHAVFKYTSDDLEDATMLSNDMLSAKAKYELAAFQLDRKLGLYLVPYTTPYSYKGQLGVLQYWIENTVSEAQLQQSEERLYGFCQKEATEDIMHIFDWLIHNENRNIHTQLYDKSMGFLWLVGHDQAFKPEAELRQQPRAKPEYLSSAFRRQLEELNTDVLQQLLGDVLDKDQIESIILRRNAILEQLTKNQS